MGNVSMEEMQKQLKELKKLIGKQGEKPNKSGALVDISENERRMKEPVEIRLFKDGGRYKDDVFVAVNGQSFQIRRGVTVKVPRYVKEVLDSSIRQDEYAAKFSEKMAEEYAESSKRA